jgi:hypothetical protein
VLQRRLIASAATTIDELLDLWAQTIDLATARLGQRDVESPAGATVFDALTHEHDIRGALGEPGARTDDPAFAVAVGFLTTNFDQMARHAGLPALGLATPTIGLVQLGDPSAATHQVTPSVSDFEALPPSADDAVCGNCWRCPGMAIRQTWCLPSATRPSDSQTTTSSNDETK